MVGQTTEYKYPETVDEYAADLRSRILKEKEKLNVIGQQMYELDIKQKSTESVILALEMALDNFLNIGKHSGPKRRKTDNQPRQANGKFGRKGRGQEEEEEDYEEEG